MKLKVRPGTPWSLWVAGGEQAKLAGTDRSGLILTVDDAVRTRQLMAAIAYASAHRVQCRVPVPEVRP